MYNKHKVSQDGLFSYHMVLRGGTQDWSSLGSQLLRVLYVLALLEKTE